MEPADNIHRFEVIAKLCPCHGIWEKGISGTLKERGTAFSPGILYFGCKYTSVWQKMLSGSEPSLLWSTVAHVWLLGRSGGDRTWVGSQMDRLGAAWAPGACSLPGLSPQPPWAADPKHVCKTARTANLILHLEENHKAKHCVSSLFVKVKLKSTLVCGRWMTGRISSHNYVQRSVIS